MEKNDEIEFDLLQMACYVVKKWWVVVLVALIFGIVGYLGSKLLITPEYTTNCRIYIYQKDDQQNVTMDYTNLQIATQICNDCEIIITGQNVTKVVIDNLDLKMSASALSNRIKVESENNTRILQLEYTDTDPERAAAILNEICNVASGQIKNIMAVDAVKTIYAAEVPTTPSSDGPVKHAVIVAAIGVVLAVCVLVVLFLMDDTIRSEEDVTRFLGLSTLAAIPACAEFEVGHNASEAAKSRSVTRSSRK
jgi:capsular polysaccharide biosynthesis protein